MPISTSTAILIGAGLSAVSAISQGQAAKKEAGFRATVAQQQAQREREVSDAEEEDFRRAQTTALAQRRAALGASGIDIGTGSPLLAASDFAAETELQALRIRSGGETRATRLEQNASLLRSSGRNAQRQGFMRAGSSLLTGFADAGFFEPKPQPRIRTDAAGRILGGI